MLDRDTVSYLLEHVFTLLRDGGRALFIETNPWNPMSVIRRTLGGPLGYPGVQALLSRTQLYELLSEIGFIRVSARFTDFVYRPLAPTERMAWIMRNASVLLENTPLIQNLAGRIVLHAQRPPRHVARAIVSLCRSRRFAPGGVVRGALPQRGDEHSGAGRRAARPLRRLRARDRAGQRQQQRRHGRRDRPAGGGGSRGSRRCTAPRPTVSAGPCATAMPPPRAVG